MEIKKGQGIVEAQRSTEGGMGDSRKLLGQLTPEMGLVEGGEIIQCNLWLDTC